MKSIFLTLLSFSLLILFGCKAEEAKQVKAFRSQGLAGLPAGL